jgi:ferric-dicitrate binding protein FerR (iron transport regulator)
MNKEELKELSRKLVEGIASDEEIQRFNKLCNLYNTSEEGWDESLYGNKKELESSIKQSIWQKAGIRKRIIKMQWFKWAAIASFILLVSWVGIFLISKRSQEPMVAGLQPQKQVLNNDVAPGQTGAILTLASGQKIVLDSAVNGSLAQQGNATVTKRNGEVIYNNDGIVSEVVYNTMTTPRGRQFNLVLSDGTAVWLNAASSITFPTAFVGKERKVVITGEAYFEVAHHAEIPFVVEKGNTSVLVLGTHFNMNTYEDEKVLSITLLEGAVSIRNKLRDINTLLKPGQQAQIDKEEKINVLNDVDVADVVSWKNGRITFKGADIETVMRQMSRWYDVEIVYHKKLDDLFYAEIPRSTMLSDVLKALELSKNVHFKIDGKKVIVIP